MMEFKTLVRAASYENREKQCGAWSQAGKIRVEKGRTPGGLGRGTRPYIRVKKEMLARKGKSPTKKLSADQQNCNRFPGQKKGSSQKGESGKKKGGK